MAESEASREIKFLEVDLDTAQLQWNTYIAVIGSAYTSAYSIHKITLENMKEMRLARAETTYFLLSALSVGFAGGLVGGMMAPWVKGAGTAGALAILREGAKGMASQLAQRLMGREIDEIKRRELAFASHDVFRPAAADPLQYYQTMTAELGICFSAIRDAIDGIKASMDKANAERQAGTEIRNVFGRIPLLRDHPRTKDMPEKGRVAKLAEMAMWIAWANVRDMEYWKERVEDVAGKDYQDNTVDGGGRNVTVSGLDEMRELMELWEFDPILKRIAEISPLAHGFVRRYYDMGVDLEVSKHLNEKAGQGFKTSGYFLDVHILSTVAPLLGGVLSKVGDVVKAPYQALPAMAGQTPIYL